MDWLQSAVRDMVPGMVIFGGLAAIHQLDQIRKQAERTADLLAFIARKMKDG